MTSQDLEPTKRLFIITALGEAGSETRKHADQMLNYVITPAAGNYIVSRADRINETGLIDSQVIERLVEDDLVIADLSN